MSGEQRPGPEATGAAVALQALFLAAPVLMVVDIVTSRAAPRATEYVPTLAALTACVIAAVRWRARTTSPEREADRALSGAFALAALVPGWAVGASAALHQWLDGPWAYDGSIHSAAQNGGLPLFGLGFVTLSVVALVARRVRAPRAAGAWRDVARAALAVVLGAGAAVVAFGVARRASAPSPDQLRMSAPVVARIPGRRLGGEPLPREGDTLARLPDGRSLVATCPRAAMCNLHLARNGDVDPEVVASFDTYDPITLRYDASRELLFVQSSFRPHVLSLRYGEDLARRTAWHCGRTLSPPLSWLVLALAGLALGAHAFAASRAPRPLRPGARWTDASLGVDGALTLPDGSVVAYVPAQACPPGAVRVCLAAGAATATYREGATRVLALRSPDDVRTDAARRLGHAALGVTATALCLTPLAVAAAARML